MKLLIWNIQNLTLTRVFDPSGNTPLEQSDNLDRSTANLVNIVRTVRDAAPDLFIIIEPRCYTVPQIGMLAQGGGVDALLHILGGLRALSAQWMLVPPLVVNPRAYEDGLPVPTRSETVGVFWRNDTLQFTGPWVWPAAARNTGPPVYAGDPATYPNYDGVIVPANTTAAPAYRWTDTQRGQPFLFPKQNDRRPLLTQFTERAGTGRTINVLAFHPSPKRALQALSRFATLLEQYGQPGANQVTVAAGDMNLDLINPEPLAASVLYFFETATWQPRPFTRVAPNPPAPTMLKRSAGAVVDQLATPANYRNPLCLDYGWVLYGAGAAQPPGAPAATVVNRVAGAAAAPPFPQFTSEMLATLDDFLGIPDQHADFRNGGFRSRWNFGHISPPTPGTSDHLPVLMVI